jgi:hypothetical protein
MDKTSSNQKNLMWARAAVARLMHRCTEHAAQGLETRAGHLLLVATKLRCGKGVQ